MMPGTSDTHEAARGAGRLFSAPCAASSVAPAHTRAASSACSACSASAASAGSAEVAVSIWTVGRHECWRAPETEQDGSGSAMWCV